MSRRFPLLDAHNHLGDPRLKPYRQEILAELARLGIRAAVVNSATEEDWEEVSQLARSLPWVIPAFGLHPWFAGGLRENWRERLIGLLDSHPNAILGEIGLDRWMPHPDVPLQQELFAAQLAIASERNLPVSIHCLKAWGMLLAMLQEHPLQTSGFLLHSYSGPEEMVPNFVKLGARFSFSPYFLHERKEAQREVFRKVPWDRLLVETDAPDMGPPEERNLHPIHLIEGESKPVNHPANIEVAYAGLAEVRGVAVEELGGIVEANFRQLFGGG